MRFLARRTRYPVGSRVKRKNGPVVIKTQDGWVSEQRFIWENSKNEELGEGDRVFFIDGNPENTSPDNLTRVRFGMTRYRFRKESGVLYIPEKPTDKIRVKR
jgi:hypothetical protein